MYKKLALYIDGDCNKGDRAKGEMIKSRFLQRMHKYT